MESCRRAHLTIRSLPTCGVLLLSVFLLAGAMLTTTRRSRSKSPKQLLFEKNLPQKR